MELTVGITGASGSIYAYRTLIHLAASGVVERINLVMSESALLVARVELGADLRDADVQKVQQVAKQIASGKIVDIPTEVR